MKVEPEWQLTKVMTAGWSQRVARDQQRQWLLRSRLVGSWSWTGPAWTKEPWSWAELERTKTLGAGQNQWRRRSQWAGWDQQWQKGQRAEQNQRGWWSDRPIQMNPEESLFSVVGLLVNENSDFDRKWRKSFLTKSKNTGGQQKQRHTNESHWINPWFIKV